MARFRKKPVVIDAVRWTGADVNMMMFLSAHNAPFDTFSIAGDALIVKTLEGPLTAQKGDWIIRGVKGEFYPCKPDIFAATYDPVD